MNLLLLSSNFDIMKSLIGEDKVAYVFDILNPTSQGVYSIVTNDDTKQGNYAISYVQGILTVTNQIAVLRLIQVM